MTPYEPVGPWQNGGPPYLSADTLNHLETNIAAAVKALEDLTTTLQEAQNALSASDLVLNGTSAQRQSATGLPVSTEWYETDTTRTYRLTATGWVLWQQSWTALSYTTGTQTPGFGNTLAYNITAGDVHLSGTVQKTNAAAWAGSDTVAALPSGLIPTTAGIQYFIVDGGGSAYAAVQYNPPQNTLTIHSLKGTTPTWLSLDPITLRRT